MRFPRATRHLLEEDPPGHRPVQHLGQRELGLQDRDVVAVAGGPVLGGERVWQDRQPLAQQAVDLLGAQPVADGLHRGRVVDSGEAVVQRGEPDTGLGHLPFGVLVAVEAQPGAVGKVGAELEEERAEVGVEAVEVPLVDHRGGLDDPRVRPALGVTAPFGTKDRGLLLRPAHEQHPLAGGEPGEVLMHHVVLALPLGEVHHRDLVSPGERVDRRDERLRDRPEHRRGRDRIAQVVMDEPDQRPRMLQRRHIHVAVHPIDALDLQRHMPGQNISHGAR